MKLLLLRQSEDNHGNNKNFLTTKQKEKEKEKEAKQRRKLNLASLSVVHFKSGTYKALGRRFVVMTNLHWFCVHSPFASP